MGYADVGIQDGDKSATFAAVRDRLACDDKDALVAGEDEAFRFWLDKDNTSSIFL